MTGFDRCQPELGDILRGCVKLREKIESGTHHHHHFHLEKEHEVQDEKSLQKYGGYGNSLYPYLCSMGGRLIQIDY
jgi:hypothetical protein